MKLLTVVKNFRRPTRLMNDITHIITKSSRKVKLFYEGFLNT